MKTRFLIFFLAVLLTLPLAYAGKKSADKPQFHPPQTEAERALDKILTRAKTDSDMTFYALGEPHYDPPLGSSHARLVPPEDRGYSNLFTEALVKAWREKEKSLVQQSCGGQYIAGELCGLDYDPIFCAQDYTDSFHYYTVDSGKNAAVIEYSFPDTGYLLATYGMIKDQQGWKIDRVTCRDGDKFNVK
jgi:hypothetical protein